LIDGGSGTRCAVPNPPATSARFGNAHSLTVDVSCDEFTSRVYARGEVDLSNADLMAAALQFALHRSTLRLTLDLSGVTFFGVSGLRVLLYLQQATAQDAIDFVLVGASAEVVKVLEVADATLHFRIDRSPSPDDVDDVQAGGESVH
jgi:anti-anti-sigma factor